MTRIADPQVSFADLEFMSQNVRLEPILQAVSDFIDAQADLVEQVRRELIRGLKRPDTGRDGLTPQQVLRSLILMRVKNWDYRELRERIADGYTLRHFTLFNSKPVPKHDAFNRAFNRLTPATLRAINDLVIQAAVALGIEDGSKLRVDTTVGQTDIHYPTDSTLLWDTVRVITRLVERLDEIVPKGVHGFADHTRFVRRRMQEIQRMTPKQRHDQNVRKYRQILKVTGSVLCSARQVYDETENVRGIDLMTGVIIDSLRAELAHYCQLGDRVIDQARRRVIEGEEVPNEEKIFSIFETHTDLIKRGKVDRPVEFGHKIFLGETGRGLITQYQVLSGNPSDHIHVKPSLERHRRLFGSFPDLYSSDRGFFSEENIRECKAAGVRFVCIPQRGGKKTPEREAYEKAPAFKKAQRFRAGIEGRISVLFRGRGMKRCLFEGRDHFELLVGAAILANNLMVIAQLLNKKQKTHRRAA